MTDTSVLKYCYPGTQPLVRELIEKHRFRVERVRDTDGRICVGVWHFPCNNGAIIYQYDEQMWAADCLTTRQHNSLIRQFGEAMTSFGEPAEIVTSHGAGDEHTLHFSHDLILPVARALRVRRRRRLSPEARAAAIERLKVAREAKAATKTASGGRKGLPW